MEGEVSLGCGCPQDYCRVGAQPSFAKCLAAGRREAERDVAALIAASSSSGGGGGGGGGGAGADTQDAEYLQGLREELCFSSPVTKVNAKGKRQQRTLVVTNLAIYNFEPSKYRKPKRRIRLSFLSKIFVPRGAECAFVLHSSDEYDYRIESARRQEIIDVISECYLLLTGEQLPLVAMEDKHIDAVMVYKSKVSKGGKGQGQGQGQGGKGGSRGQQQGGGGQEGSKGGGADGSAGRGAGAGEGAAGGGGGAGGGAKAAAAGDSGGGGGGGGGSSSSLTADRLARHGTAVNEVDRLQARAQKAARQAPSDASARFVRQASARLRRAEEAAAAAAAAAVGGGGGGSTGGGGGCF